MGINSDIITSYPKGEAIMIGLRSFSPDIIICDEIATEGESLAIESGVNSGVHFALSIHAKDEREIKTKPIINYIGIWLMFYINITCGLALLSQEKIHLLYSKNTS